jgi:two-component system, NarL family, response regulator FusR
MKPDRAIAAVYDDHHLFADSFSALIERLGIFRSTHMFTEERELIRFLIKHSQTPLYLFLDFYLKDKNALPLLNEIKRLNRQAIIIVVSSVTNPLTVANILSYNPRAMISKSSGFDTLIHCLTAIERGDQYFCPVVSELAASAKQSHDLPFTSRELEILQYFARGLSIAHTAEQAHLSKHTVVAHRRKMMAKAQVNSITELLAYARNKELI